MAVDRSKFKRTSASQLAQQDKELNKTMGRKEKQGNGHDIEDGSNLFRIYPVHPDIAEKHPNAVFAQPFVQTFIPAMVQDKDKSGNILKDSDGKPKLKEGVKPVFNAKVHGGFSKDLIDEYISLAVQNAKDMGLQGDDYKEYLKPIYGAYSKDPKKNINGINYPQVWIMYADKYPNANPAANPVFDELRIKKAIKERLNKISAIEAANDPLGTDPFTDIEEGRAIKILKDSAAENPQNYYTTELDSSTVNEVIGNRTVKVQKAYPLSDEQLDHFLKQEPLFVKYGKKLATRKNFESQLAGLEMFDTKWEMGIFELPKWSEIVAECDSYYPENDAASEQADDQAEDNSPEPEAPSGDEFDLMDRKELTTFCKDNKTGILVRPNLTDDAIREKLREWKAATTINHIPLPNEEGYVEPEVTQPPVKEEETKEDKDDFLEDLTNAGAAPAAPDTTKMSAKERLEFLRNKNKPAA